MRVKRYWFQREKRETQVTQSNKFNASHLINLST
uniref:Uncharacterized protein n=1 Tax=Arundo donax TaxID=35708 RepID=A0A0A8YRG4_ARUDO